MHRSLIRGPNQTSKQEVAIQVDGSPVPTRTAAPSRRTQDTQSTQRLYARHSRTAPSIHHQRKKGSAIGDLRISPILQATASSVSLAQQQTQDSSYQKRRTLTTPTGRPIRSFRKWVCSHRRMRKILTSGKKNHIIKANRVLQDRCRMVDPLGFKTLRGCY